MRPCLHKQIRDVLSVYETASVARIAELLNKKECVVRASLKTCFGVYVAEYTKTGSNGAWQAQWKLVHIPASTKNPKHMTK